MAESHRGFVLFVDDDEDSRALAEMVLLNEGFRCRAVATADEAVRAVALLRFDVIVVDLGLPGAQSGAELAVQLAALRDPSPFLFQTGRPPEDLPGNLPEGGYLLKPYFPEDLVRAVIQTLESSDSDAR